MPKEINYFERQDTNKPDNFIMPEDETLIYNELQPINVTGGLIQETQFLPPPTRQTLNEEPPVKQPEQPPVLQPSPLEIKTANPADNSVIGSTLVSKASDIMRGLTGGSLAGAGAGGGTRKPTGGDDDDNGQPSKFIPIVIIGIVAFLMFKK